MNGASRIAALICAGLSCFLVSTGAASTWTSPATVNPNASSETRTDDYPKAANDGNGNWISVWQSNQTPGLEYDIMYSRSSNNGTSWTATAFLNSDAAVDGGQDINPSIAYGQGTFICVWSANVKNGIDSDIYFQRSTNNGTTWTAIAALNSYATTDTSTLNDYWPTIASDGKGNWVATWRAQNANGPGDFLMSSQSLDNGVTWQPAKLVSPYAAQTPSSLGINPKIASDGNGTWILSAFSDNITSPTTGIDMDILAWRSTNNGATWSGPIVVNTTATSDTVGDTYMDIAGDGRGTWVCTWATTYFSSTDLDIACSRSTDGGLTWSAPIALNGDAPSDARTDLSPSIATDKHGSWTIAWHSETGDWDMYYVQSPDNGLTWSAFTTLNTNASGDTGQDDTANVGSDGAGKWIAVWRSTNSIGGSGTDKETQFASTTYTNPWLHSSGPNGNFGTAHVDSGPTSTLSFILQNDGLAGLTFTGPGYAITGTNASEFSLANSPSTAALAAGTSRTVQVAFDPSSAGGKSAQLYVFTNDPTSSTISFPLSGAGVDQHVSLLSGTYKDFGQQLISGGPTPAFTTTIQNTGANTSLQFTGLGIYLTGSDPGEFQISNSPPTTPLAPSLLRQINVVFDPNGTGIKTAQLVITTDDPFTPMITVQLNGVGISGPTAAEDWQLLH